MFKKYFLFSLLNFSGINPEVFGYTENITKRVEVYTFSLIIFFIVNYVSLYLFVKNFGEDLSQYAFLISIVLFLFEMMFLKLILKKVVENIWYKVLLFILLITFSIISTISICYQIFYNEIQIYSLLKFVELPSRMDKHFLFITHLIFINPEMVDLSGTLKTIRLVVSLLVLYVFCSPFFLLNYIFKSNYQKLLSIYEKYKI
jgi:hypothetical protein